MFTLTMFTLPTLVAMFTLLAVFTLPTLMAVVMMAIVMWMAINTVLRGVQANVKSILIGSILVISIFPLLPVWSTELNMILVTCGVIASSLCKLDSPFVCIRLILVKVPHKVNIRREG